MRLILRCVVASIAVTGCIYMVSLRSHVRAQSCCNPDYCPLPPPNCPTPLCNQGQGTCNFYWTCNSPIVLDLRKEGFHLTSEADGVLFKFSDTKKQVAWTDPRFGNAWLALDRNGNGTIDDATELFGNFTPQPPSANPNGFRALAVFDSPEKGGNGDGAITAEDKIYSHLLVWTDLNHNGISEPNELQTLAQAGITSIPLEYQDGHKVDQYGNVFHYTGHVRMDTKDYDHLIYDVWLVGTN
jgi:hypothetical protein